MKAFFTSCVLLLATAINTQAVTPAERLIAKMKTLQKRGIMIGHQDDPVYGTTWKWDTGKSDVRDVCGDYPAVMGFDLGKIELGSETNIDGVPFSRIRKEIIAQHERGGIITLSWHLWNPATNGKSWDTGGNAVKKILPGGELNRTFQLWLGEVSAFINSLKDRNGKQIPVIFRPWHEMSGGWFWWGIKSCTPGQYKQLFRYTHQMIENKTNGSVVWAYSPHAADKVQSEKNFLRFYPGNDYVDLIGFDLYQRSTNEAYMAKVRNELDVVTGIGRKRGKIVAITETGYQNNPCADWYTTCLLPAISDYTVSFVLMWRNAWNNPKENYITAPGKNTAKDFCKFYEHPSTLFVRDLTPEVRF